MLFPAPHPPARPRGQATSPCDPREVRCGAMTLGERCTYLGASRSLFSSCSRLPLLHDKIGVKWAQSQVHRIWCPQMGRVCYGTQRGPGGSAQLRLCIPCRLRPLGSTSTGQQAPLPPSSLQLLAGRCFCPMLVVGDSPHVRLATSLRSPKSATSSGAGTRPSAPLYFYPARGARAQKVFANCLGG